MTKIPHAIDPSPEHPPASHPEESRHKPRAIEGGRPPDSQSAGSRSPTKKGSAGVLSKAPVAPSDRAHANSDDDAQLPHERDQSVGRDSTQGRGKGASGEAQLRIGKRAVTDLAQGQVDTDLRATPGLDAEHRESIAPRTRPSR